MYGFPLTIYLLSGWLSSRYPGLDLFSHQSGHLWNTLLGLKADPHFSGLHLFSELFIVAGFIVIGAAWKVLYEAQRSHQIATRGLYAHIRHPQYVGFILVLAGLLIQWPTLITLLMFPVLVVMYVRLAKREEVEARAEFGDAYVRYAAYTPAFIPGLVSRAEEHPPLA